MTSSIYNGTVIHKRFKPKKHYFKYSVFSLLIDLSDLNSLNKNISFFSYNRFNLISFFDKDHGQRDGSSLTEWVKKNLEENNIFSKDIRIKLLCYPRIFGYVFNPLSVFFVYDHNENLISILYEVKNTFGEQHTYIFRVEKNIIDQYQQNEKILFASQEGKRVDFTTIELLKSYIKHPLMTFKIISAIHFEAFKLWLKGIKFVKKKLKIKNNITFEN